MILYQLASFGVSVSGSAPFTYQWRKDGVNIAGATNDELILARAQFSDAGLYSVVVSNAKDSATSTEAALSVNAPAGGDVDGFGWRRGGHGCNREQDRHDPGGSRRRDAAILPGRAIAPERRDGLPSRSIAASDRGVCPQMTRS